VAATHSSVSVGPGTSGPCKLPLHLVVCGRCLHEIRHSAAAALVAITLVAVGRDAATERAMMAVADTSCGDALAGPATRAAGAGAATTVADVAAPAAGLATAAATTAFAGLGQPSTAFAELQRDACTGTAMAGEASRAGTGEAAWTDMAGAGEAAWAACIACVSEGVRAEDQVWEGGRRRGRGTGCRCLCCMCCVCIVLDQCAGCAEEIADEIWGGCHCHGTDVGTDCTGQGCTKPWPIQGVPPGVNA